MGRAAEETLKASEQGIRLTLQLAQEGTAAGRKPCHYYLFPLEKLDQFLASEPGFSQ